MFSVIDKPHQEIRIRARGEVEVADEPLTLPDTGRTARIFTCVPPS
jgi:hypothetical protein